MDDPRHRRFYALRKRQPDHLTSDEAREVVDVCRAMMEFVRSGKERSSWQELAREYESVASRDIDPDGPAEGRLRE